MAFVETDFTSAMSSACFAVCERSSLNHVPHFPPRANLNTLGATGNRDCPLVIVVMRCPLRTLAGRSSLKRSTSFGL
jgi:hypothetical protein